MTHLHEGVPTDEDVQRPGYKPRIVQEVKAFECASAQWAFRYQAKN